ncbi:MAG: hypothetical protein H6818_13300 [Phycisphaerales bacterium]|nr:hypothetical protein [Phycisphaerales bacterium]
MMNTRFGTCAALATCVFILAGQSAARGQCMTEPSGFAGGSGSQADPYRICNAAQLSNIRNQSAGQYFILTADIDLSGGEGAANPTPTHNWDPIVLNDLEFDGMGHSIDNLMIDFTNPDEPSSGALFAHISNGHIRNVTLNNVAIESAGTFIAGAVAFMERDGYIENVEVNGTIIGASRVGGVVGRCWGFVDDTHIKNCRFSGTIECSLNAGGGIVGQTWRTNIEDCKVDCEISGGSELGGIVGDAWPATRIYECLSRGSVTGTGSKVGGIAGIAGNVGGGIIDLRMADCYSESDIHGDSGVGGLVGANLYLGISIENCYAVGSVSGNDASTTNGMVGCYSTTNFSAKDCYWNTWSTGQANATGWCGIPPGPGPVAGMTGLNTAQMFFRSTYENSWDFCGTWIINDGNDYPRLVHELAALPFDDFNANQIDDECDVPGDFTGDGHVGLDDVGPFVQHLLTGGDSILADINGDASNNGLDVQAMVGALIAP